MNAQTNNLENKNFPLKRESEICFKDVFTIFRTMSKEHRVSFTERNITGQDLKHFTGLIIVENKTIQRTAILSDYFQEQHRITAKRSDQEYTPFEYWQNNPSFSRKQIQTNVKECTTFCPIIICSLIKTFRPKHILDFSAGWGDRLIGAMSYDHKIKSYYGIDPNKSLHTGYKNMIRSYLPKHSHSKYNMIHACAEDVIDDIDQRFDLVCTSPPYFDLEVYSDHSTQSIQRYPKFEDWYAKFLLRCTLLSVSKLEKGGVLAININDFGSHQIVDRLIRDVNKGTTTVKFKGIIYFGNPKCKTQLYQPILIWEKNV